MFSKWTIESKPSQNGSTILFPGFATDFRVWDTPQESGCIAYPKDYSTTSLNEFRGLLSKMPKPIHIVGLSLGGFIAVNLLNKCSTEIAQVTLYGVRQQYPKKDLDMVRKLITRDAKAYLKSFYRISFVNKGLYQQFKDHLEQDYLQRFTDDMLLQDIDHLEQLEINATLCDKLPKLQFVHGARDAVAPLEEVEQLHNAIPSSKLDIQTDRGHLDLI